MSASGLSPRMRDPGGAGAGGLTNNFHGSYAGQLVPAFMDKDGTSGAIQVLRMEAVNGALPTNPFLLRLSVEKWLGKAIDGAFKEKRGLSYALKVRSNAQVQKLLKMNKLSDGTQIRITEHPQHNKTQCVVSNSDCVGMKDDELLEYLADQGVRNLRRIKRKGSDGNLVNTPIIILTIAGTVIPEHIDFGWSRCKTRNYYPDPMRCYNCWEYGHTRSRCQQPNPVCGTCSEIHPNDNEGQDPLATEHFVKRSTCTNPVFCKICKCNSHSVSSRKCPVYVAEVDVQHIRIDRGISYIQAKKEYEASKNHNASSFAGVVNLSRDKEIAELSSTVKQLLEDSKKKDQRIEELESMLLKRGVNSRIDQVQQNGTIEDLIVKVNQLSHTISSLQATLKERDREIAFLRKIYVKPINADSCYSDVSTPGSPNKQVIAQVSDWVDKNCEKKKNKKNRKKNDTTTGMEFSSDDSMKSTQSNASLKTTTSHNTNTSNLSKRNHPETDSSSDSNARHTKPKRTGHGSFEPITLD